MLPTKFSFIWPSGFRGEDFLEIDQSETRIACGGHVCKRIRTTYAILIASTLKRTSPDISRPKNIDTILMHWMSVKSADNFQIREHSWPHLFHIILLYRTLDKSTE
jgi:hypothetical protein